VSLNRSKLRDYISGISAGGISEAIVLVAGFANLWLLTQILEKNDFGVYALIFAILRTRYLSLLLGFGTSMNVKSVKACGSIQDQLRIRLDGRTVPTARMKHLFLRRLKACGN
jgi:hypothetical protein